MGFSISWLAVQTADVAALLGRLQLAETDEEDEVFEAPISGGLLKSGWYLVVAQGEHRVTDPRVAGEISKTWPCVTSVVEEHVMFSAAHRWRGGRAEWSIVHDSGQGINHLDVAGDPPPSFAGMREAALKEQADEGGSDAEVDLVFDLPLLIAKELTGYKHDESGPEAFEAMPKVLRDLAPPKPGWKFWA
jgi:hypothetical protein